MAELLTTLGRAGRHLPLAGLNAAEVRRFAELAAGRPLPLAVAEGMTARPRAIRSSSTRSYAACKLHPSILNAGKLAALSAFPISHGVRGAIRLRLAPLAPACRSILAAPIERAHTLE